MSKDLFTIDLQIFIQMFLSDFRKEQLGIKSPVTLMLSYGGRNVQLCSVFTIKSTVFSVV